MAVHDWTKGSAGTFHAFHNAWIAQLQEALNAVGLPAGYYSLGEQLSGDRIVAMIEILSPENKKSRHELRKFTDKVMHALDQGFHLLLIDLIPPSPLNPNGIHGYIWEYLTVDSWHAPSR